MLPRSVVAICGRPHVLRASHGSRSVAGENPAARFESGLGPCHSAHGSIERPRSAASSGGGEMRCRSHDPLVDCCPALSCLCRGRRTAALCCPSCRDYISRHCGSSSLGNNCRRGPYQRLGILGQPDYGTFGGSLCNNSGHSSSTSSRISSETSERPSVSDRNLCSRSKSSCIMMWSATIRGA